MKKIEISLDLILQKVGWPESYNEGIANYICPYWVNSSNDMSWFVDHAFKSIGIQYSIEIVDSCDLVSQYCLAKYSFNLSAIKEFAPETYKDFILINFGELDLSRMMKINKIKERMDGRYSEVMSLF